MASIAAMMTTATTRVQSLSAGSSAISVSRISKSPALMSKRFVRIRCMAEPTKKTESTSGPVDGVTPVTPLATSPAPTTPPPTPKPKVSTNFGDVFAFSGPAPETINGRLAMLGFVAALGVELGTGNGLLTQIGNGGSSWFILAASIFTYASLVPMFKGVTTASKSKDFFSVKAETWNGRAAMVGLVALAITEFVTGNPLI